MSDVIKAFRPIQKEKDIEIILDLAADLPTMYWDRSKITQVIQNLLGNALKFTPHGGRVSVAVRLKGDFIEFQVSDNGIGIPKEHVEQIFDRFFQVDSSPTRQYGGSGLGLSFTREIVHAHNGMVFVESKEGVGSIFLTLLPQGEMKQEGEGH
ncbi:MAG: ATP-binding protein [bacterium]|nr:ATP-binding protein [bacterium]